MASYRYERDIDPADLAPRAEKQYTRKERWANWWDYNLKWVLLIGIAAAFVAYSFSISLPPSPIIMWRWWLPTTCRMTP